MAFIQNIQLWWLLKHPCLDKMVGHERFSRHFYVLLFVGVEEASVCDDGNITENNLSRMAEINLRSSILKLTGCADKSITFDYSV